MINKEFEILWTKVAEDDLWEIIEYIARDGKPKAKKILTKIQDKTLQLKNTPQRGRIVPEFNKFNIKSIREVIISPWRVFYKIDGNFIYIMGVIDSRRNIEDVLLNRFLRKN